MTNNLERVTKMADSVGATYSTDDESNITRTFRNSQLLAFKQMVLAKRDEEHDSLVGQLELEIATLKQHNIELMALFQERDAKMQAAWSAYKARELYLQHKIDQIAHFSKSITAVATPAPESYLGRRIEDEQIY